MNYKTKGLEMLMYDGVHPDAGEQHPSWQRTWVSISDVVEHDYYDYRGLGFVYFVDFIHCKFHCFEDIKIAREKFDKKSCVWVTVSCHQCYRIDECKESW